jgi:hypothetical protein
MCSENEINFLAAKCVRKLVVKHDLRSKIQKPAGQILVRGTQN